MGLGYCTSRRKPQRPAGTSDETSEAISSEVDPLPPKSASHLQSCPLDGGGGFAGWVWEGGWGEGVGFQRSSAENRLGAGAGLSLLSTRFTMSSRAFLL